MGPLKCNKSTRKIYACDVSLPAQVIFVPLEKCVSPQIVDLLRCNNSARRDYACGNHLLAHVIYIPLGKHVIIRSEMDPLRCNNSAKKNYVCDRYLPARVVYGPLGKNAQIMDPFECDNSDRKVGYVIAIHLLGWHIFCQEECNYLSNNLPGQDMIPQGKLQM